MVHVLRITRIIDGIETIFCARGHIYIEKGKAKGTCYECLRTRRIEYNMARKLLDPSYKKNNFMGPVSSKSDACELCGLKIDNLHMDHDYLTRKFRGWLCHNCNRSLKAVWDFNQPRLLAYLVRTRPKPSEIDPTDVVYGAA